MNMFQIDLENHETVLFAFEYRGWSARELEQLPYYRFEGKVERLVELLKKQRENENSANKQANKQSFDPTREANKFMKKVGNTSLPKPPRMPKF